MARLGFVGLGLMGQPMAANLVKAGHEVIGYDSDLYQRCTFEAGGDIMQIAALKKDLDQTTLYIEKFEFDRAIQALQKLKKERPEDTSLMDVYLQRAEESKQAHAAASGRTVAAPRGLEAPAARTGDEPVRRSPEDAEGSKRRRRLGRTEARLRGRIPRVDARRPPARAVVPGPPR